MIGLSWLGHIICELVVSNSYLDFSLISIDSNYVSLPVKGVSVLWGLKNCRLLVVDSLPRTAIEHHVTNWWFKKKKKVLFSISDIKVPSHVQQVRDIRSFLSQEVHSSVKIIRVDVHKKLTPASVKEGQKLDVSVVNYVSSKSKAEPR